MIIIGRFEGEKLAEDWVEYDRYNLFRHLGAAGEMLRRPSKEALARPTVARTMSRRFARMSVIEVSLLSAWPLSWGIEVQAICCGSNATSFKARNR